MRALLAEAALQRVDLIFLDGSKADLREETVAGEFYRDGVWNWKTVSLPDVIAVCENPLTADHATVSAWLQRSRPVIDDQGVDKLTLFRMLENGPLDRHAIPTVALAANSTKDVLATFMRDHGAAVVKAATGRMGIGLYFLHAEGDRWMVRHDRDIMRGTFDEAIDHVSSRIAGRQRYRDYLAQRYVHSVAADGRPADIRVHMQRDGTRQWRVTRAYARLAELGMPLTNISKGGYQGSLTGFLEQPRLRPPHHLLQDVLSLAARVTTLVDDAAPRPLSELGIDLALDENDHLWVIEANDHPQSSLHEQDRAMHFIAYAQALANLGFRPSDRRA